jgi:KDO2-lipid IV(A) lauroyltransferase
LVRANLERVVSYLAANAMGGDAVRAAADDGAALDRMTRAAFGHYVRGYLESATLARYARPENLARIRADDQALADEALRGSEPMIIVAMHFGSIEIPGVWATRKLGRRITSPMETVADPDIQDYFERTRGETGLNVIPVARAATELRAALARGETVALVADRPVGGGGTPVRLFGAPARLPVGPAVLAFESGAPTWLIVTRRVGRNQYRSRVERIPTPAQGSRREQLSALLDAEARAFERAVADAPEQWWTTFFPIWDDIRPNVQERPN